MSKAAISEFHSTASRFLRICSCFDVDISVQWLQRNDDIILDWLARNERAVHGHRMQIWCECDGIWWSRVTRTKQDLYSFPSKNSNNNNNTSRKQSRVLAKRSDSTQIRDIMRIPLARREDRAILSRFRRKTVGRIDFEHFVYFDVYQRVDKQCVFVGSFATIDFETATNAQRARNEWCRAWKRRKNIQISTANRTEWQICRIWQLCVVNRHAIRVIQLQRLRLADIRSLTNVQDSFVIA